MTGKHSLEDLLKLARNKFRRNHQKRHSTNKERSYFARRAALHAKETQLQAYIRSSVKRMEAQMFWDGVNERGRSNQRRAAARGKA